MPEAAIDPPVFDTGSVVVSAWAPWCTNCRAMEPIVAEVSANHSVRLVRVRVDQAPELVRRFDLASVPVYIALHDGQERARLVGAQTATAIGALFDAAADPSISVESAPPVGLAALRAAAGSAMVVAGLALSAPVLWLLGVGLLMWAATGAVAQLKRPRRSRL